MKEFGGTPENENKPVNLETADKEAVHLYEDVLGSVKRQLDEWVTSLEIMTKPA